MPYSSTRPDTLHYEDLSSNRSSDEDQHPIYVNNRISGPQKRVTISERRDVFPNRGRDTLGRLEAHNVHLSRENVLLKEQLRLKEEAMRLHGIQIMTDVVHLLDQHHIQCDQHRDPDLSPPPQRERTSYENRYKPENERIGGSPYERELQSNHTVLAEMGRGDNGGRNHAVNKEEESPSIDSVELEELLERSCRSSSSKIGKPKYTSTPATPRPRRRSRYKAPVSKARKGNCNVNARHRSPPDISFRVANAESESDIESLNLSARDDYGSNYFPRTKETTAKYGRERVKEIQQRKMQAHWEDCEHRGLHVAPRKPPVDWLKEKKSKSKERKRRQNQFRNLDLNRTYTVSRDGSRFLYSDGRPLKASSTTDMTKHKQTKRKTPTRSASSSPTIMASGGKQAKVSPPLTPGSRVGPLEREIPPITAVQSNISEDVTKVSLLESNGTRVLGEIAFQLDKRILCFVLNGKFNRECKYKSFYGYNVVNLQQRIVERETGEIKEVMLDRYKFLMRTLHSLGYVFPHHANFAVTLVNKYGVMKQTKSDSKSVILSVHDEALLRDIVKRVGAVQEVKETLLLLQCLAIMSADDGLPMFIW